MAPTLEKPSTLTVPLLRAELAKCGLSTTGLKAELVARLAEAMEGQGGGGSDDADGDAEMVRKEQQRGFEASLVRFLFIYCLSPIRVDKLYALKLEKKPRTSALETEMTPSQINFDVKKKSHLRSLAFLLPRQQQQADAPVEAEPEAEPARPKRGSAGTEAAAKVATEDESQERAKRSRRGGGEEDQPIAATATDDDATLVAATSAEVSAAAKSTALKERMLATEHQVAREHREEAAKEAAVEAGKNARAQREALAADAAEAEAKSLKAEVEHEKARLTAAEEAEAGAMAAVAERAERRAAERAAAAAKAKEEEARAAKAAVAAVAPRPSASAAATARHALDDDGEGEDEDAPLDSNSHQQAQQQLQRNNKKLTGSECPYLDTIDRSALDFDFAAECSVSLATTNVYCCLVCGRYYAGKGSKTPASTHSLDAGHHVFMRIDGGGGSGGGEEEEEDGNRGRAFVLPVRFFFSLSLSLPEVEGFRKRTFRKKLTPFLSTPLSLSLSFDYTPLTKTLTKTGGLRGRRPLPRPDPRRPQPEIRQKPHLCPRHGQEVGPLVRRRTFRARHRRSQQPGGPDRLRQLGPAVPGPRRAHARLLPRPPQLRPRLLVPSRLPLRRPREARMERQSVSRTRQPARADGGRGEGVQGAVRPRRRRRRR